MRMTLASVEVSLAGDDNEMRSEDGEDAKTVFASAANAAVFVRAELSFRKPTKGSKTWRQVERHRARFDDARASLDDQSEREMHLSADEVRAFVRAADDANPLYVDNEAAEMAGLPGPIAPPLLLARVFGVGGDRTRIDLARPLLVDEVFAAIGNPARGALVSKARNDVVALYSRASS